MSPPLQPKTGLKCGEHWHDITRLRTADCDELPTPIQGAPMEMVSGDPPLARVRTIVGLRRTIDSTLPDGPHRECGATWVAHDWATQRGTRTGKRQRSSAVRIGGG